MVEKQHYIPRLYLNKFRDSQGLIHRYDNKNHTFIKSIGPKGIGFDTFYFSLKTGIPDELSQEVENAIGLIENQLGANLPKIEEKILNNYPISLIEKYTIACLIALILINHPSFRKWI